MYVLGLIFESNTQLKKFDTVLVTRKERDNVVVWNTRLNKNKRMNLTKLKKKNPTLPPAKQEEEGGYKKENEKKDK